MRTPYSNGFSAILSRFLPQRCRGDLRNLERDNPYSNLLFRLGYVAGVAGSPPIVREHWATWSKGRFWITYDPEIPFHAERTGNAFVAMFGRFVSLNHPSVDQ